MALRFKRILFSLIPVLVVCLMIEIVTRVLDPFPYFSVAEINFDRHGGPTQYDPTLGWKGVSNATAILVTQNNRIEVRNNSEGFRDIEHAARTSRNAIVFLGDSFAWGYEVSFDEMMVNLLRPRFPELEIFNLSHRGYGTDQSVLTFRNWKRSDHLKLVILMFSENDFENNVQVKQYDKFKPRFDAQGDELVLTHVPVPRVAAWQEKKKPVFHPSWKDLAAGVVYRSHFLNDMRFRVKLLLAPQRENLSDPKNSSGKRTDAKYYRLTQNILKELKRETSLRGAPLTVISIPSKREFIKDVDYEPYQRRLKGMCDRLEIPYMDLTPAFRKSILRTYYRHGSHWNQRGHKVAARAVADYLERSWDLK